MTATRPQGLGNYYTGRVAPAFFAHLFKGIVKQHHPELIPLFRGLLPNDAIVFDVGAHAGQFTKLFARLFTVLSSRSSRRVTPGASSARRSAAIACAMSRSCRWHWGRSLGWRGCHCRSRRPAATGLTLPILSGRCVTDFEIEAVAVATLDQRRGAVARSARFDQRFDIEGGELRMLKGSTLCNRSGRRSTSSSTRRIWGMEVPRSRKPGIFSASTATAPMIRRRLAPVLR